jgi:hypothetical protein
LVITSRKSAPKLKKEFSRDRCVAVLARPYSPAELEQALRELDVNCSRQENSE